MPTVKVFAPQLSGATGLALWLRKTSDQSLVNADGDALTETSTSGWFSADVAETWTERLSAAVIDADGLVPQSGWLGVGETVVADVLTGAVELDADAIEAIAAPILAALQGSSVVQVASPNVQGNLVLTQGDDYDGVANPRAQWTVATDYTTGWTVRLTIRDTADAVVYTTSGNVVSATVVAVTIAAPTGLAMTGCPGQWQGKFDVELTHSTGKKKTIALGTCYINEDQTRA